MIVPPPDYLDIYLIRAAPDYISCALQGNGRENRDDSFLFLFLQLKTVVPDC